MNRSADTFDWLKPSPLWAADGRDVKQNDLFRPRLLRFDSDHFMDDFLAAAADPSPAKLEKSEAVIEQDLKILRLYQPVHGSFYLVCASLCCREPGFPDRAPRRKDGDRLSFVLRKLNPAGGELAWSGTGKAKTWKPVKAETAPRPADDEERLPLVPAKAGNGRTVHVGFVPAASRETFAIAKKELVDPGQPSTQRDLRRHEFGSRFTGNFVPPGKKNNDTEYVGDPLLATIQNQSDRVRRTTSVYVLLDAIEFFQKNIPGIVEALAAGTTPPGAAGALVERLREPFIIGSAAMGDLMKTVAAYQKQLNADGGMTDADFDAAFGDGKFDLTAVVLNHPIGDPTDDANAVTVTGSARALNDAVEAALPPLADDAPTTFRLPRSASTDRYVLRLVYERTACVPQQIYVSRKTEEFELAGIYDADAPVRQAVIPLPTDVSIAGIRKMKKNVTFVMSDAMRRKMAMVTGHEKDLLNGDKPGDEGGIGVGFICSFSIQIIFIIAFMLILIFVIVFNLMFWWIFFFKICFPVPKKISK